MQNVRHAFIGMSVLAMALTLSGPAWATMDNLKSLKEAYPGKTAACKECHLGAIGKTGDLNAYGLALQKAKADGAKKLTPADYKAIETQDADQDGASNLDEINAGTNPGDPASTPAKK